MFKTATQLTIITFHEIEKFDYDRSYDSLPDISNSQTDVKRQNKTKQTWTSAMLVKSPGFSRL